MSVNRTMNGRRIPYGIRRMLAHRPTSGRLRMSSMTFPTYIDATTPQKKSGCSIARSGPGR